MARKRQAKTAAPADFGQPVSAPARTDGRVAVRFTRPHRHADAEYLPGDRYFATPEERELLLQFDVIEPDRDGAA